MRTMTYVGGLALTLASTLFLIWVILAVGLLGVEGDPDDRLYLGVIGVGALGAAVSRLRPSGMATTLMAMAGAQLAVTSVAFAIGKHLSPISSIAELLGVNAIFVVLFLIAAGLFRIADRGSLGSLSPTRT